MQKTPTRWLVSSSVLLGVLVGISIVFRILTTPAHVILFRPPRGVKHLLGADHVLHVLLHVVLAEGFVAKIGQFDFHGAGGFLALFRIPVERSALQSPGA